MVKTIKSPTDKITISVSVSLGSLYEFDFRD